MRLGREGKVRGDGILRGRRSWRGCAVLLRLAKAGGKRGREESWGADDSGNREQELLAPTSSCPGSSWNLEEHHDAIQRSSSPRMTEAEPVQPGIPTCIRTSATGSTSTASPGPRKAPLTSSSRAGDRVARQAHTRALRNPESTCGSQLDTESGALAQPACSRQMCQGIIPRRSNRLQA